MKYSLSTWINDIYFDTKTQTWLELFQHTVTEFPGKTAIFYNDITVSYKLLDEMSNWYANQILDNSIDNNPFIGICIKRSPSMLAAMIGVQKAGKAYLPLDFNFPILRLKHMISDSGTSCIITDVSGILKNSLGSLKSIRFINSKNCTPFKNLNKYKDIEKDSYAYMLYTSGSTGAPKGVVVSHDSFLNFLLSMKNDPGCSPEDSILALTTISFDISGLELFLPLISGASIHLVAEKLIYAPEKLNRLILNSKISIIQATPVVWKILLDIGFKGKHGLKLLCGGDTLSKELANNLYSTGCDVWNMYGPTETTIWSSICKIDKLLENDPPLGMPISNTGLYILDEQMRPVPQGETGQLYISGAGLTNGYWKQEELTNSVFCFSLENLEQPLYKTGDFVYESSPNNICFLGRNDTQIKIRGLRIEAGEIEQALIKIDGIEDSVVLSRKDIFGNSVLVGFYISQSDSIPFGYSNLREHLSLVIPDYMIPTYFYEMDQFPLTMNRKIDRKSFPDITLNKNLQMEASKNMQNINLKEYIHSLWSRYLNHADFGNDDNFFDIGGHSLLIVQITQELSKYLNKDVQPMLFFQNPTVNSQSNALSDSDERILIEKENNKERTESDIEENEFSLAIIGLSCAVPGAANIDQFWTLLEEGRSGIVEYTEEELLSEGLSAGHINQDQYVKKSGMLPSTSYFDAGFFGYSPKEAKFMDPQHRLMLEHCYTAFESSGIIPWDYQGKTGVFASAGQNKYLLKNILFSSEKEQWSDFQTMIGNENDFLANRVAYKLNLRGPALTVQTGCSSSLVAVQLAYQSLLNYQCDMALCGGVSLNVPIKEGYRYKEGAILSPSGECRAFDEDASGTIFGSGIGVVLLKRLNDAIKDKDPIVAVIRGAAVNNDGHNKIGFTAPSIDGQAEVIKEAHSLADIHSSKISYIEAHGTGTKLGDPIEIAALSKAFGNSDHRDTPCYIGSVKTNIGHLDAAAGIIGLIKTALSLQHKKIPASLNYKNPNPEMEIDKTPFQVNTELRNWEPIDKRCIAGVSSFGIGGTNAHVLLESFNGEKVKPETENSWLLFPVSSKASEQTEKYKNTVIQFLEHADDGKKMDTAFSLAVGRKVYKYRNFFIAPMKDKWDSAQIKQTSRNSSQAVFKYPQCVFLFPGQSSQYAGMGKELYKNNSVFKGFLDKCLLIIDKKTGWESKDLLFNTENQNPKIDGTQYTQPLLFAFEWSLGKTLLDFSVPCNIFAGHSLGEFPAACLAGAFSLEDGIQLVIDRGYAMAQAMEGAMLAIYSSVEQIREYLPDNVDIAGINTPSQVVVSGEITAIYLLEKKLSDMDIICKNIGTKSAFHSQIMDPVLDKFLSDLNKVTFFPLEKTVVSNVTGELLNPGYLYDKEYWVKHLRNTILFEKGIRSLEDKEDLVFVEVGPGAVLSKFVRAVHKYNKAVVPTQPSSSGEDDSLFFIKAMGNIWKTGIDISFGAINSLKEARRISVPTYPFVQKKHWIYPDSTMKLGGTSITLEKDRFPIPPNNVESVCDSLKEIWKEVLGYDEIEEDQNFFDLGGDSLLAVELLSQINKKFSISLKLSEVLLNPDLKSMNGVIDKRKSSEFISINNFPIMFPVQEKGTQTPLFLVAGAHENHYFNRNIIKSSYEEDFLRYFSSLISFLGKEQPIYGFRPKGIFLGEKAHKNVLEMASSYIHELKKVQPKGPYIIGGECVGGMVAIEIANLLNKNGDVVDHLILMDTPRPGLWRYVHEEYFYIKMWIKRFLKRNIIEMKGEKITRRIESIGDEIYYLFSIFFPLTKHQRAFRSVSEGSLFYQRKLLSYRPKKYKGKVTMIVNEEWNKRNHNLNWDTKVFPQLDVVIVPGDHMTRLSKYGKISGEIIAGITGKMKKYN